MATYKSRNLREKISAGIITRYIRSGYQDKIQDILKGKDTVWRDRESIRTRLGYETDIGIIRLEI